ncbi:MAG: hypothetical protein NTV07_01235 [Candidatus Omnitrophica bacterium]|nr:hypothetical protein [Candidatus Omnitrophota bacterium]
MSVKSILILVFITGIVERLFSMFFRKKEKDGIVKYGLLTYLLVTTYLFCLIAILYEFVVLHRNLNVTSTLIGFFIVVIAFYLRKSSIQALGDFWSIHIKIIPAQPIITSGPYRWLKNPYYISVMFELVGWSLFLNSFLALWVIFALHFPLIIIRVFFEEKTLITFYGKKYKGGI